MGPRRKAHETKQKRQCLSVFSSFFLVLSSRVCGKRLWYDRGVRLT